MKLRLFFMIICAAIVTSCDMRVSRRVPVTPAELAAASIIVDGHIDIPHRLNKAWADVSMATEEGDFDYPRALAGGLNAPFMSICIPADKNAQEARELADSLISLVNRVVDESHDKFAIAFSVADVRQHFQTGLISLPMGLENGSPIGDDLEMLRYFHERSIRYITLAHSKSNLIADSSYDEEKQWDGLSDFGLEVVREMNRLGIMIDISHVSDDAFWDVMEVSEAPVIASHSSARHFTPDWERNIADDMMVRVAESGGIVMINFGSMFITAEGNRYARTPSDAFDAYIEESGRDRDDELQREFYDLYDRDNGGFPYATLEQVLDHFDHMIGIVGVDHVGIGSDYDGVGDALPAGLKDVSSYPNLIQGLRERGHSDADLRKLLGENLLRV